MLTKVTETAARHTSVEQTSTHIHAHQQLFLQTHTLSDNSHFKLIQQHLNSTCTMYINCWQQPNCMFAIE